MSPAKRIPACTRLRLFTEIRSGVRPLDQARRLQAAAVNRAQAVHAPDELRHPALGTAGVAGHGHVLFDGLPQVRERVRRHGVQRAHDIDARRYELAGLLAGGPLRHAQQARGPAGHRRGERHRCVHQDLPGLKRWGERLEVFGLGAKRHCEQHDGPARDGHGVLEPGHIRVGNPLAQPGRRPDCPSLVTRADDDWRAGASQPQGQPKPRAPVPPTMGTGSMALKPSCLARRASRRRL